jgi:hypothetical protein
MTRSILSTTATFALLLFTAAAVRADIGENYEAFVKRMGKPSVEHSESRSPGWASASWITPKRWTEVDAFDGRISTERYTYLSSAEAEEIMTRARVHLPNGEVREFTIENRTERITTWSAGRFGRGAYQATYCVRNLHGIGDIAELYISWERDVTP